MLLSALAAALVALASARAGARSPAACSACHAVASHVSAKLQRLSARLDEPVAFGSRPVGPDGDDVPASVVPFSQTQQFADELMDGACAGNKDRAVCSDFVLSEDDAIRDWIFTGRQSASFEDAVCSCVPPAPAAESPADSASAGAPFAVPEVEVHDEPLTPPAAPVKTAPKATPKAAPKEHKETKKATDAPAADPLAIVSTILGRMRNNLKRIRALGIELGGEIAFAVRTRDSSRLKAIVKDKDFLRKYWILFLAIFTVVYTIVSTVAPLFAKAKPAKTKAGRRPRTASPSGAAADAPATPRKTRASSRSKTASADQ